MYSLAFWNLVIRPPRALYHTWQLGPSEFTICGVETLRRDFKLQAKRGGFLACSQYFPKRVWERDPFHKHPVVVYLHGNSSNRLEAVSILGAVLSQGISLFCFDSAGCGQSDGQYVSLGWHERDDLASVLSYLRESPFSGPIGLWGRSMGAVTVLLHADRDQSLGAICMDSPFLSLRQVVEDLATSPHVLCPMPFWLVAVALAVIRLRVRALADFDIDDVAPLEHAKRSFVPALFMHGQHDTFIPPTHSRELYDAYMGDKEYVLIDGDHNSERGDKAIRKAVDFFRRAFRMEEVKFGRAPPRSLSANWPASMGPGASMRLLHSEEGHRVARQRSMTPPPQPRRVYAPAPPEISPLLERQREMLPLSPLLERRLEFGPTLPPLEPASEKDVLRIAYSPDWEAVLEEMLVEIGWASDATKATLLVTDKVGNTIDLFKQSAGKIQAPSSACFPLKLERLQQQFKAARGGG